MFTGFHDDDSPSGRELGLLMSSKTIMAIAGTENCECRATTPGTTMDRCVPAATIHVGFPF
jgi:hypothetical protein